MERNRTKLGRVLALVMALVVLTVIFAALPVGASSAPSSSSGGTVSTPEAGGGSVTVVSYALSPALAQIKKDDTFDLIVKIFDSRPEVVAAAGTALGAAQPYSVLKPVAKNNNTSFVRTRDMSGYNGYPDYQLVSTDGVDMKIEDGGLVYTFLFPLRYTGTGSAFAFNLMYEQLSSVEMVPVTVSLNTTVDASEEEEQTPSIGTGFVMTSSSYGGSEVLAGKPFTLTANIMATDGTHSLSNVLVTAKPPTELKLSSGNNSSYVGTMSPGKSATVSFELLPNATAEEGSYTVSLTASGISAKDGTTVEKTFEVTVPVAQPERFEISNPRLPEYLTANNNDGSGYSYLDLVNKGKGAVYNVEVLVEGEGLSTEEGTQYVGTINGGAQYSAEFTVLADMAGSLKGTVIVRYENSRGEEKQLTHEFALTADEMMVGPDMPGEWLPEPDIEPQGGGMPNWAWALIVLCVVVAGVVVLIVVIKKNKAKKAAALEAELGDDDFDSDGEAGSGSNAEK